MIICTSDKSHFPTGYPIVLRGAGTPRHRALEVDRSGLGRSRGLGNDPRSTFSHSKGFLCTNLFMI